MFVVTEVKILYIKYYYIIQDGNGTISGGIMKEPWKYKSQSECLRGLGDKLYGSNDGEYK